MCGLAVSGNAALGMALGSMKREVREADTAEDREPCEHAEAAQPVSGLTNAPGPIGDSGATGGEQNK